MTLVASVAVVLAGIYLHGVADNRMSGTGIGQRFAEKGFDVFAYDSRAHGESGGEACTYGFYEKQDLVKVLDTIAARPIVLFGVSLGAAVALQAAALDHRIAAVVAIETFSDLRTVARERVPSIVTDRSVEKALALAEQRAAFQIHEVSPAAAAAQIRVPVLLIHGAKDRQTPPAHSRRVFETLPGAKRFISYRTLGTMRASDVLGGVKSTRGWMFRCHQQKRTKKAPAPSTSRVMFAFRQPSPYTGNAFRSAFPGPSPL